MRIGRWIPCLVGLVLAAGIGFVVHDDESIAKAEPQPAPIVAPRVLMLSGHPGSTQTQLMVASAGTNDTPKAIATLDHIPEAVVKGALLPGGNAALVIADTIPSRELSWAASLMIIEKGQPPRKLVEGVYHASRPLVTADGRVFVQRGKAGKNLSVDGHHLAMRVDDLSIDEVDLATGSTRSILSWKGYETHLAASIEHEIIVYRVGPQGADLVAIHADTRQLRVVVPSWPPMARDFSVDEPARAIVVQQLGEGPVRQWVVERIDVDTGKRQVLATSPHLDLVPYAFPDGSVLVNPADRRGPRRLGASHGIQGLDGPGVMWLRATSEDRAWMTGTWAIPGSLPVGIVVRASDGKVVTVPRVEGHRVEILGLAGGAW